MSLNENTSFLSKSLVNHPKVILSAKQQAQYSQVPNSKVEKIICHRHDTSRQEQYLVEWSFPDLEETKKPCSWHRLNELTDCLPKVQIYIDNLPLEQRLLRKRNISDLEDTADKGPDVINGVLTYQDGVTSIKPVGHLATHKLIASTKQKQDSSCSEHALPTREMLQRAASVDTRQAQFKIRNEFDKKLHAIPTSLEIINQYDGSRPPLDFEFIDECKLGRGVIAAAPATIIGCGNIKGKIGLSGFKQACRPDMGSGIGCQYSRVCECLEFASVDTNSLTTSEDLAKHNRGETAGLPKRFPYGSKSHLLTKFYMNSRNCIYECNPRCKCGPECRTRVVQNGRTVPLQIFKTIKRGWGLRCKVDLRKGQFVDTYRGEIITDSEAETRERNAVSGQKASYLYSLDKHVGQNNLAAEDCYVVDGEFMGGPTRFLNHSCDPNLRQYTVSYNKYDPKIYDLAFFACHDIPAGAELTFDYLDKDEEDLDGSQVPASQDTVHSTNDSARTQRMECLCESENCRGILWV